MYRVDDLYKTHHKSLELEIINGKKGLNRLIKVPEAHRPGLGLSGFVRKYGKKRILLLGRVEIEYLSNYSIA